MNTTLGIVCAFNLSQANFPNSVVKSVVVRDHSATLMAHIHEPGGQLA